MTQKPYSKVLYPLYVPAASLKNADQWGKIIAGRAGQNQLLSIRQLYEMCLEDCELLKELINDLDKTLAKRGFSLFEECYNSIKQLIEELKKRGQIDALIKIICEEGGWKMEQGVPPQDLRTYGMPLRLDIVCPWGDCPP